MSQPLTIVVAFPRSESRSPDQPCQVTGRIPRVTRLLALAMRLEGLVRSGAVANYAELARLGHVSRPRIAQLLSLLNLAPDIQEEILFWPPVQQGRAPIILPDLQPIAQEYCWHRQRRLWQALKRRRNLGKRRISE